MPNHFERASNRPRPDEIYERNMHDFLSRAEESLRERGISPVVTQEFLKTFEEKFAEGYSAFMKREGPKNFNQYLNETLEQVLSGPSTTWREIAYDLWSLRAADEARRPDTTEKAAGTDTIVHLPRKGSNANQQGGEDSRESERIPDFRSILRDLVRESPLFDLAKPKSGRIGELAAAEERRTKEERLAIFDVLEKGEGLGAFVNERFGDMPSARIEDAVDCLAAIYDELKEIDPDYELVEQLVERLKRYL